MQQVQVAKKIQNTQEIKITMKKIEISLFKKNLTVDTNSSEFQYIERIEYSFIVYIE